MKYLWIAALILLIGIQISLKSLRRHEQQENAGMRKKMRQYIQEHTHKKKAAHEESPDSFNRTPTAEDFFKEMVNRGYLTYTDPEDTAIVHTAFVENIITNGQELLPTLYTEEQPTPLDHRYYACNGGVLYMEGGFLKLIDQLRPTFKKMNFICNASDQSREWVPAHKWTNETIVINDTTYTILHHFTGLGYREAPARFAEILNQEFEKQGLTERIYLVSSKNNGKLVILTPAMHDYLRKVHHNEFYKPLTAARWRRLQEL